MLRTFTWRDVVVVWSVPLRPYKITQCDLHSAWDVQQSANAPYYCYVQFRVEKDNSIPVVVTPSINSYRDVKGGQWCVSHLCLVHHVFMKGRSKQWMKYMSRLQYTLSPRYAFCLKTFSSFGFLIWFDFDKKPQSQLILRLILSNFNQYRAYDYDYENLVKLFLNVSEICLSNFSLSSRLLPLLIVPITRMQPSVCTSEFEVCDRRQNEFTSSCS